MTFGCNLMARKRLASTEILKPTHFSITIEQGFPTRGAKQHPRGCEMVIQIFLLHFCPVMLSSSCVNSSAQSVSNYSMPNARPSLQPETMRGYFFWEITSAIMVRKLRNLPA